MASSSTLNPRKTIGTVGRLEGLAVSIAKPMPRQITPAAKKASITPRVVFARRAARSGASDV